MSIPFSRPFVTSLERENLLKALDSGKISGDHDFSKSCERRLESLCQVEHARLTTSGTHALELCALQVPDRVGAEVIMPSFTFTSTANAFLIHGMKPVFVDIRPDTMNIDEKQIEAALTPQTKAICVVHYGGVACEMDSILEICRAKNLVLVEDAAHAVMAEYKSKRLGSFGDMSALSFHETKNYTAGEGGAFLTPRKPLADRSEIIREKGTNRSAFFRGEVDKYTWVDIGSSYVLSDLNAALLDAQLTQAEQINDLRLKIWNRYFEAFKNFAPKVKLPHIPSECKHNAHLFYLKFPNLEKRMAYSQFMREHKISCPHHYVPLHTSPMGRMSTRFVGADRFTTKESDRLVRLPLFAGLTENEQAQVISLTSQFISKL